MGLFDKYSVDQLLDSTKAFIPAYTVFDEMLKVYTEVRANKELCSVLRKEIHMPTPSKKDVGIDIKVILLFYVDLVKCLQNMGHKIDFKKRDSYLLPMAVNLKFKHKYSTELEFKEYMAVDSVRYLYEGILLTADPWAKQDGPEFILTRFAKDIDKEICNKYVSLMINASKYAKTANPGNAQQEDKWISDLEAIQY
jgi:hypothetical protein